MGILIAMLLSAALAQAALTWTGHGREYAGLCGKQRMAMVILEADGWAVYDQRDTNSPERPGTLAAVGLPDRMTAQRRASRLVRCTRLQKRSR